MLPVEAVLYKGTGDVKATGMLGQVMDESIKVALSYIKSKKELFKIELKDLEKQDIHIHFLEGAIKKDGPSAGVAIVTSLLSLLLSKKVSESIAMTGEISLRGDVLKIGGLKEKLIAAYNNGIKKVFVPYENSSDLSEIPVEVKEDMKIILVKNYKEIFNTIFK